MTPITFKASLYRDLKFDQDGGGRLTLQFDAMQEAAIIHLLTMRNRLLEISVKAMEGYE